MLQREGIIISVENKVMDSYYNMWTCITRGNACGEQKKKKWMNETLVL